MDQECSKCICYLIYYNWRPAFYRTLTSTSKELQDNFLKALAVREEGNRNGKVSVSTFHPTTRCVTEETS